MAESLPTKGLDLMRWLGCAAGTCVALGVVIAVDHLGGSDHVLGLPGSALLTAGLVVLGWLIGRVAERSSR